jgi:hypothetical protein
VELPGVGFPHRYRLVASIVLAEIARQLGARRTPPARRRFTYESALPLGAPAEVDLVTPQELHLY